VLLAPEAVGLCGTDIQILRRMRPDPAAVVGHEGFARVVATGRGVEAVEVGQRVMVNPTAPHDPDFLLGHNVPGLFQERVLISAGAVAGGQLLVVPEAVPAALGTLTEPLSVVTYGLECLRRAGARHLVVDGGGLIGLLAATQAERVIGPGTEVTVLHRHDHVRRWAAGHVPGRHVVDDGGPDLLAAGSPRPAREATGLLAAVYRDATVPRVARLLRLLGDRLVAVHTIGGVPTPAVPDSSGGVDLAVTRSDNTGGPWPPHVHHGAGIQFTGNRGVTNERLRHAATSLRDLHEDLAPLLTHTVGQREGLTLANRIIAGTRTDLTGAPIIRLVVRHDHTGLPGPFPGSGQPRR
jgi:threonine dehydrogenase-like Zn-dependent dehydrogenase